MIKASALYPVTRMNPETMRSGVLARNNQNIVIEYSEEAKVPVAVEVLAVRMLKMDDDLKDILNEFRVLYTSKKEEFLISLSGRNEDVKKNIVNLFQDFYGIITDMYYYPNCEILTGKLSMSTKAQRFICGQYMEIAIKTIAEGILKELSKTYQKKYTCYSNVKVTTKEGQLKNEFDIVIENVDDAIVYVIEAKSGKNFRDFDRFARIGKSYGIVPDRLLLVDNYLTDEHCETIEYFCDYYVANLKNGNLETKLKWMLEKDLL